MSALSNKVVIVTGASSGIGEATARLLGERGARVVLAARRQDRLRELEHELCKDRGHALAVECDVTSRESVRAMVDKARSTFGPIDALINNAGVMLNSRVEKLDEDDWNLMVDVNIKGVLNCTAAVLTEMAERSGGHIVNVSSVAGRRTFPMAAVYCGTKHFVHAFSEGLRAEMTQHGVRVTIVAPGLVKTELHGHGQDPEFRNRMEGVPDNFRWLTSEDIARAIMYAMDTPPHVDINEILVRPTDQEN